MTCTMTGAASVFTSLGARESSVFSSKETPIITGLGQTSPPPSGHERDFTFRHMIRIVFTWRSHRMLGKLQNCGFMRYRIERRGRMVSIDFEALANSDETVHW